MVPLFCFLLVPSLSTMLNEWIGALSELFIASSWYLSFDDSNI